MRRTFGYVVAFLGMMAGMTLAEGGGKLPFEVSGGTTGVVKLGEDGMVDYVGAMNEKYGKGVRAEENGYVVWLKVVGTGEKVMLPEAREGTLKLLGIKRDGAEGEVWESYYDYLERVEGKTPEAEADERKAEQERVHTWKGEENPKLANFLAAHAGLMKLAEEASEKPAWWSPTVSKDGPLYDMLLPSLGRVRSMGDALADRAMLRAEKGDFVGFVEDVSTIKRLARKISGGTLIERLVGIAMDSVANKTIAGAASEGIFTAEQCAELRKRLDGYAPISSMVEPINVVERWSVLEMAEKVAVERDKFLLTQEGDSYRGMLNSIELSAVDWNVVPKRINESFDELSKAVSIPSWAGARNAEKAWDLKLAGWRNESIKININGFWRAPDESREAYSERIGKGFIWLATPSMGRADELWRRVGMEREMVDVVLNAAAEKTRTGKWPEDVKDLPIDMYTGEGGYAVQYVVREKGVEVYSVGQNGKDDGGWPKVGGKKEPDDLGVGAVPEVKEP